MIESFSQNKLEEKIDQYVNGQLSQSEVDELWAELIQDGYHLDYLKTVANLKEVVKKKRERRKASKMKRYWSYAAAAVLALTIGILGVMNLQQTGINGSIQPIESIELDYYRSSEGTLNNGADNNVIRDAITLANTGQFDQATALLSAELEQADDPQWISELNLNLGSLYYNEGNYRQSTDYFQKIIAQKESETDKLSTEEILTLEKAYWYLGNAYFQLDELDKAKENIEHAYALNGEYRRVAKSYLNAFSR
jgi:tetratricopeptide (TPR) repeat protein